MEATGTEATGTEATRVSICKTCVATIALLREDGTPQSHGHGGVRSAVGELDSDSRGVGLGLLRRGPCGWRWWQWWPTRGGRRERG